MDMHPRGILLCDPAEYDVIDVKNAFMAGNAAVDKDKARRQWEGVATAFAAAGADVEVMRGEPSCEDMVFCANTALTGLDACGERRALTSRMLYPSRQREIEPTALTFERLGYALTPLPEGIRFEGGGDAIWHLGRHRIFGGTGPRSERKAYDYVEQTFGCEVVHVELALPQFYHFDTCFCVLNENTALAYRPAFTEAGFAAVSRCIPDVIEVSEREALHFACNACAFGNAVLIEQSAVETIAALETCGFDVIPLDTSEFMKSGGSVYCMKQYLF